MPHSTPVSAKHARGGGGARAALAFLALPVLVPSLFVMRVLAWRRGPQHPPQAVRPAGGTRNVPEVAIAISSLLLVIAATQIPRLGIVAVVAIPAIAVLYAWRRKLELLTGGACFGWSNAVVVSIIAGGALIAIGVAATVPPRALLHTSALYEAPAKVTTAEIAASRVVPPKHVEVVDGRVDATRAYYRIPGAPAWFDRMPPDDAQGTEALETWAPLMGTKDDVWVAFMGTNLLPLTAAVDGHLVSAMPVDAVALTQAQAAGSSAAPAPPARRHPRPSASASTAPVVPSVTRVILVGTPSAVAQRTARMSEVRLSFDWSWAWLLAIGLVATAFGLWRAAEEET